MQRIEQQTQPQSSLELRQSSVSDEYHAFLHAEITQHGREIAHLQTCLFDLFTQLAQGVPFETAIAQSELLTLAQTEQDLLHVMALVESIVINTCYSPDKPLSQGSITLELTEQLDGYITQHRPDFAGKYLASVQHTHTSVEVVHAIRSQQHRFTIEGRNPADVVEHSYLVVTGTYELYTHELVEAVNAFNEAIYDQMMEFAFAENRVTAYGLAVEHIDRAAELLINSLQQWATRTASQQENIQLPEDPENTVFIQALREFVRKQKQVLQENIR